MIHEEFDPTTYAHPMKRIKDVDEYIDRVIKDLRDAKVRDFPLVNLINGLSGIAPASCTKYVELIKLTYMSKKKEYIFLFCGCIIESMLLDCINMYITNGWNLNISPVISPNRLLTAIKNAPLVGKANKIKEANLFYEQKVSDQIVGEITAIAPIRNFSGHAVDIQSFIHEYLNYDDNSVRDELVKVIALVKKIKLATNRLSRFFP